MEKKKLLLVAVSVGVFLVIVLGAAILVFSPKNAVSAVNTVALSTLPERIPAGLEITPALPNQPASMDPSDLVRNPGSIQGLQAPPVVLQEENNYFVNSDNQRQPLASAESALKGSNGSNTVIRVPQPLTAAVPEVLPAEPVSPPPSTRPAAQSTAAAQTAPAAKNAPAAQAVPAAKSAPAAQTAPAAKSAPAAQAAPAAKSAPAARPSTPAAAPRPKPSTPAQTASSAPAARSTPTPASTVKAAVQAPANRNNYWVQTGSFSTKTRAEGAKDMLAAKGITPIIENRDVNGKTFFRVRVGPYTSQNEADYWLSLIKNINGFEDSQIWISQSRL
jgi:cell division protein FtsN